MDAATDIRSYLDPRNGFCVEDVRELIRHHCRFALPHKPTGSTATPSSRGPPRVVDLAFLCQAVSFSEVVPDDIRLVVNLGCSRMWLDPAYGGLSLCGNAYRIYFRWSTSGTWVLLAHNSDFQTSLSSALRQSGFDLILTESDFVRVCVFDQRCERASVLRVFAVLFDRHLKANSYTGARSGVEHCDVLPSNDCFDIHWSPSTK